MKKITLLFLSLLFTTIGYSQTPTSDAPTPTENSVDVISIFSGSYTDITGVNLNPFWGQSGHGTADTNFDRGSGDISLKYPNFNYQGIDFDGNRQNVSGMEKVHIDIWTNSANVGFYLIWAGGEVKVDITSTPNAWQSLDINLSSFAGADLTTIRQLKFDGGSGTDEIYIDNIYFWKAPTAAGTDATLSDLKVDGTTVTGFAPGGENYSVGLVQGAATPQITLATTTDASATRVITQAPSVPGNATVVVTAADATTQKTYTVSFDYTIPNTEAPTPTIAQSDVVSIFSNAYTAPGAPDYNPNWGQSGFSSANTNFDINSDSDGNAVLAYTNFNYQGMQFTAIDASTYDFVHMDIWTAANPANTTIQISPINNGTGATETLVSITYSKGQWTTITLPKSSFTGMTWDSVFQFKIAANGAGSTVPVDIYVDNIYFSKAATNNWVGTTSTNWGTDSNWSTGSVPTLLSNVVIPSAPAQQPVIDATTGAVVNNLTVEAGASLNITGGGSIIVNGTSTGNVTYNVAITDTNWHLISAPVDGVSYDDTWIGANGIASGTVDPNNRGIGVYNNTTDANGSWAYYATGSGSVAFNSGQGYAMKRTGAGNYSFTGTILNGNGSRGLTVGNEGLANENKWNLVGNTHPSYVSVASLLTNNATQVEDTREAVYVYNGTTYVPLTTGYVQPGQAFFISASSGAAGAMTIAKDILSHQTGVSFYRTTNPRVTLSLTDGTSIKSTEINYLEGKTKGLDRRFDLGTFTGASTNFSIFSHLVNDSQGVDFMRQALPQDYENLIIPIGVKAEAGKEITFTADALSLPQGIKVFLEDKTLNSFTRLDLTDGEYKVQLDAELNGIGRFYLHTRSSVLSTNDFSLEGVSLYKTSNSNLRITGLTEGKASISLFNIQGKEVFTTSFNANHVNDITIPRLSTGIYIAKLNSEKGSVNKKIILE